MLIHASCLQYNGKGILFIGDSGCGKSTAALALIEKGATLVADDYTEISIKNDKVHALCPENIFGKIEARGVGIMPIEAIKETFVDVVIQCEPDFLSVPRLPESRIWEFEGKKLPFYRLCPFENIFNTKVLFILATL